MVDPSAIPPTGVCDLTTTGRRTGLPRTVEIWYVVHDGQLHIVGSPGRRDWYANLAANPHAVLHLRDPDVSLDVTATVVHDRQERGRLTETAWLRQPWYANRGSTAADWVDGAPMVRLSVGDRA
ncbi:hypothetical protein GCM10025862_32690 [Arsenicicoccus piscis]|uniref:Nitroreductase family deazaflavin-dependent oxidoreductase n=2 Tax=Arsenicicoccus piscis TaxID=673954 RepID=A0ABQ6HU78_9MICO|nr:hypothetical protein GCM10025862_32690 [Arsenicicoccus piscis]